MRGHHKILELEFRDDLGRPERDNKIYSMLSGEPAILTQAERGEFLAANKGSCLGSDAFFPFPDNIERSAKSGVTYIAQPGGSIRDNLVIKACDDYGISMVMTGHRLFHH